MNKKIFALISALVIVALSACGADTPPTLSAADVESTAVAAAWTSLVQTQEALPTLTLTPSPIPPTATIPAIPASDRPDF